MRRMRFAVPTLLSLLLPQQVHGHWPGLSIGDGASLLPAPDHFAPELPATIWMVLA